MNLKEKVKNLPMSPGVYLMKDAQGTIIYVGKAKKLKNRVQSYFRNSIARSQKVEKLKKNIYDFDYLLMDTEFEAFLHECQLIKELKPFFNKKMKSPQSYSYIVIRNVGGLPRIEMANQLSESDNNLYFGPFISKATVEKAIQTIKAIYKIDCKNLTKRNGACLNYSLGSCIGVCLGGDYEEEYKNIIGKIVTLLDGSDNSPLKELEEKMEVAAEQLDFEMAAKYKENIDTLKIILNKEKVVDFTKENRNMVICEALNENFIKVFLIKGSKVLLNKKYIIEDIRQMSGNLKKDVQMYFKLDDFETTIIVGKDDIDEAQIIYSYLKNSNCSYLVIPDIWLPDTKTLADELSNFLKKFQKKMETYSK